MKFNILIVDDDQNLLDALKRAFHVKKDEFDPSFADSADDALSLCQKQNFDFIVCDYKMPGMDGLTLLGIIKEKHPSIKRILLTGQSETEIYDKAKEVAQKYIAKPCAASDIMKAISEIK